MLKTTKEQTLAVAAVAALGACSAEETANEALENPTAVVSTFDPQQPDAEPVKLSLALLPSRERQEPRAEAVSASRETSPTIALGRIPNLYWHTSGLSDKVARAYQGGDLPYIGALNELVAAQEEAGSSYDRERAISRSVSELTDGIRREIASKPSTSAESTIEAVNKVFFEAFTLQTEHSPDKSVAQLWKDKSGNERDVMLAYLALADDLTKRAGIEVPVAPIIAEDRQIYIVLETNPPQLVDIRNNGRLLSADEAERNYGVDLSQPRDQRPWERSLGLICAEQIPNQEFWKGSMQFEAALELGYSDPRMLLDFARLTLSSNTHGWTEVQAQALAGVRLVEREQSPTRESRYLFAAEQFQHAANLPNAEQGAAYTAAIRAIDEASMMPGTTAGEKEVSEIQLDTVLARALLKRYEIHGSKADLARAEGICSEQIKSRQEVSSAASTLFRLYRSAAEKNPESQIGFLEKAKRASYSLGSGGNAYTWDVDGDIAVAKGEFEDAVRSYCHALKEVESRGLRDQIFDKVDQAFVGLRASTPDLNEDTRAYHEKAIENAKERAISRTRPMRFGSWAF